ncbi:MAG: hypothetical protein ABIM50_11565 [Novosphingobium sp.]
MAIVNPKHLLDQAERLLRPSGQGTKAIIRQADRRRAISSAYYAVFHFTLAAVADQFVGKSERNNNRYTLAYRSIDHSKLECLCKVASREKIDSKSKYAEFFPDGAFEQSVREFASLLIELKEKRNAADYDPSHWVSVQDARNAIKSASSAIENFERAPSVQKMIFLTLLVFPPR